MLPPVERSSFMLWWRLALIRSTTGHQHRPQFLELVDSRDDLSPTLAVQVIEQPVLDLLGQFDLPSHNDIISADFL